MNYNEVRLVCYTVENTTFTVVTLVCNKVESNKDKLGTLDCATR